MGENKFNILTPQQLEDFFIETFNKEKSKVRQIRGLTGRLGAHLHIEVIHHYLGLQGPHQMPPNGVYNVGNVGDNSILSAYDYKTGFDWSRFIPTEY